jgi:type I restriction enzyme M protein
MPTNAEILKTIFSAADLKFGLKLFSEAEIKRLTFSQGEGKTLILCPVTGKKKAAKPEEVVRQLMIDRLHYEFGYDLKQMGVEVPIKMGSTYASKKADIVVYREPTKQNVHLIVECKKPSRSDGLEQLESYMNATGVWWGCWLNGNEYEFLLRREPNNFQRIPRLPAVDEDIEDVLTPIKKKDLQPIEDLKEEIQQLEDEVLANAGVQSTFDEVFKLLYAKLWDEFDKEDDDVMDFRTTTAPPKEQKARIQALFDKACDKWKDIFEKGTKIELSPEALVTVASAIQHRRFTDADMDVIDAAFEYMINPEQKGDKGQYFTPRQVVDMCVKMLDPKLDEYCLDPACGPCGFMIHTLNYVFENYVKARYKTNLAQRKYDYANSCLYALDYDPRLARVARFMMLIAGDGKTNVYRVSTLDPREWGGRDDDLNRKIRDGSFDVLMTNPPFAGTIKSPEILGGYDLAYKGKPSKGKRANKMTRDVLFIERCLRLLKPGGRMAIVLPQGNLNNTNAEYIRNYIFDKARMLAVVGLHVNTFKPFTGTKTSVLFVQKWRSEAEKLDDYRIFMATSDNTGKDNSGEYIFKRNPDRSLVRDKNGKPIKEHDLDQIANEFIKFAKTEGLDFWS